MSRIGYFHKAIQKYGKNNFVIEQIDSANNLQELNEKEVYWISKLNTLSPSGYNLTIGGDSNFKYSKDVIERTNTTKSTNGPRRDSKNKYKGVLRVFGNRYQASVDGKRIGYFKSEKIAAYQYDVRRKAVTGENCYLNFPNGPDENLACELKNLFFENLNKTYGITYDKN